MDWDIEKGHINQPASQRGRRRWIPARSPALPGWQVRRQLVAFRRRRSYDRGGSHFGGCSVDGGQICRMLLSRGKTDNQPRPSTVNHLLLLPLHPTIERCCICFRLVTRSPLRHQNRGYIRGASTQDAKIAIQFGEAGRQDKFGHPCGHLLHSPLLYTTTTTSIST